MRIAAPLILSFALGACGESADGTLADWRMATDGARDKVAAENFPKNADYVKKCITRMAAAPANKGVKIIDAGRMCETGLRLRSDK